MYNKTDPEDDPEFVKTFRRNALEAYVWKAGFALLGILIVIFILTFIIFPTALMKLISLQRRLLFNTKRIHLNDIESGTRNFYVSVDKINNISLGVAHYLPSPLMEDPKNDSNYLLRNTAYPVLLYFHGNGENRLDNSVAFKKLREIFHIVCFDYRGYGDSTSAELTEEGIVRDCTEVYKWLRNQTDNIFIWGKSLGAAIAIQTLARLRLENLTPICLVLEAPFTTLREEISNLYYARFFSWLPWFSVTVLDGFEKNFKFESSLHIVNVDCPIMILHAEDDSVIPYHLGEKLFRIAQYNRKLTQGRVSFHLFPAKYKYDHWGIPDAPEFIPCVKNHIVVCQKFRYQHGTQSDAIRELFN